MIAEKFGIIDGLVFLCCGGSFIVSISMYMFVLALFSILVMRPRGVRLVLFPIAFPVNLYHRIGCPELTDFLRLCVVALLLGWRVFFSC